MQAAAASAPAVPDDKGEESKDKAAMDTGAVSAPTAAAANATVEGENRDSNADTEVNEESLVKQVSIHGGVRGGEGTFFYYCKKRETVTSPLMDAGPCYEHVRGVCRRSRWHGRS